MILAGEPLFTSAPDAQNRIVCTVCLAEFNLLNGAGKTMHARGHLNSGLVKESLEPVPTQSRIRYAYTLTDTGAAAANRRRKAS